MIYVTGLKLVTGLKFVSSTSVLIYRSKQRVYYHHIFHDLFLSLSMYHTNKL